MPWWPWSHSAAARLHRRCLSVSPLWVGGGCAHSSPLLVHPSVTSARPVVGTPKPFVSDRCLLGLPRRKSSREDKRNFQTAFCSRLSPATGLGVKLTTNRINRDESELRGRAPHPPGPSTEGQLVSHGFFYDVISLILLSPLIPGLVASESCLVPSWGTVTSWPCHPQVCAK